MSCETKSTCDFPTRFCCEIAVDVPAGFTGEMTESVYPDRLATITTESCEGPFKVVVTNEDGTVHSSKTYTRGEAFIDTMYIEQPEPPYDLAMIVKEVYKAEPKD